MAQRNDSQNVNYLSVNKDGLLYKKVNEDAYNKCKEKGGNYVQKITLDDGRVVFHETFSKTEEGYLSFLGIVEKEFKDGKVKYLVISVKGEEETDSISFPLFKTNGSLNDYVKHTANMVENWEFEKKISISPTTKKNDAGYVNKFFYVNYVGEDDFVRTKYSYKDDEIPKIEKTENIDGSTKYDTTKQDKFFYDILVKGINSFKEFKETNELNTESEQVEEEVEYNNNLQTEEDDLPF